MYAIVHTAVKSRADLDFASLRKFSQVRRPGSRTASGRHESGLDDGRRPMDGPDTQRRRSRRGPVRCSGGSRSVSVEGERPPGKGGTPRKPWPKPQPPRGSMSPCRRTLAGRPQGEPVRRCRRSGTLPPSRSPGGGPWPRGAEVSPKTLSGGPLAGVFPGAASPSLAVRGGSG